MPSPNNTARITDGNFKGVDIEINVSFNNLLDLIEWMVVEHGDAAIQSCFLLAYRIMFTSDQLYEALHAIIERHKIKSEPDSTFSKLNIFLYMWGELSYNYEWKSDTDRLSKLMELAKATALSPGQFAFFKQLVIKDSRMKRGGPKSMTFTPDGAVESSPTLVRSKSLFFMLRKSRSKTDDFMPPWFSIEADLMAAQITISEHEQFSTIKVHELIPGTKHATVDALAVRFNEMAGWVATQVLTLPQPKMQASAIKRFIVIIEQLLLLNNFQSAGQILSGLFNSSVRRLKRTWALLSSKTQGRIEKIEAIMSPTQNFMQLRELIKDAEDKPLIPYLPLILRDITFINDGNPNKNEDGSLNLSKVLTLGKYLFWFKAIAGAQYRLPLDTTVQKLLIDLKPLDEDELYKRSLEIEPKNSPALLPVLSDSQNIPPDLVI